MGPYSCWFIVVRACVFWYHPLVNHTSTRLDTVLRYWRHSAALIENDINTRGSVVWIVRSFPVSFVVSQTHRMHGGVILGKVVNEHDLNQITNLASDCRPLSTLESGLLTTLAEGAVGVATV